MLVGSISSGCLACKRRVTWELLRGWTLRVSSATSLRMIEFSGIADRYSTGCSPEAQEARGGSKSTTEECRHGYLIQILGTRDCPKEE